MHFALSELRSLIIETALLNTLPLDSASFLQKIAAYQEPNGKPL